MSRHEIDQLADAGFNTQQIDALRAVFASRGHSHSIDDIVSLADKLEDIETDVQELEEQP